MDKVPGRGGHVARIARCAFSRGPSLLRWVGERSVLLARHGGALLGRREWDGTPPPSPRRARGRFYWLIARLSRGHGTGFSEGKAKGVCSFFLGFFFSLEIGWRGK